ncbi:MAG: hypothetical protein OIF58_07010 [Cohaesibacter sp.]|nr:hypothetical protein [Cohaesibacter sp.]
MTHLTSKPKKGNKSDEKYRSWIEQAQPDDKNTAYFQLAATADCVACVRYWLEQGEDATKGQEGHPQWDAVAWARWAKAYNVLPLLEAASREGLGGSEKCEKAAAGGTDGGGCWDSEVTTQHADLEQFIDTERHRKIWRDGLAGDWKEVFFWCQICCGDPMSLFVFREREKLPYRLYYWSWLHFIQLASLSAEVEDDRKGLLRIKDLIWARERDQVIRTMEYIMQVMPEEDSLKHESLIDLLHGNVHFKEADADSESQWHV